MFLWANDPLVRKWSFSGNKIKKKEHSNWFKHNLLNENVLIWIFSHEDNPAGLVRFEKKRNKIILNYQISAQFRGQGLASIMLTSAMKKIQNTWSNMNVVAYTLPENIASKKSLLKVGFKLNSENKRKTEFIFMCRNEEK